MIQDHGQERFWETTQERWLKEYSWWNRKLSSMRSGKPFQISTWLASNLALSSCLRISRRSLSEETKCSEKQLRFLTISGSSIQRLHSLNWMRRTSIQTFLSNSPETYLNITLFLAWAYTFWLNFRGFIHWDCSNLIYFIEITGLLIDIQGKSAL